jgi:hypothetical protein
VMMCISSPGGISIGWVHDRKAEDTLAVLMALVVDVQLR